MIKLTKNQIREIYQELDCGMRCFFDPDKKVLISLPDIDTHLYVENQMWEEIKTDQDLNLGKLIEFKKLPCSMSYELMIEFTDTIGDKWLQECLLDVLDKQKPIRNFMFLIDNSTEYRMKWFEFKEKKYCKWIESQILDFNKNIKRKKNDK